MIVNISFQPYCIKASVYRASHDCHFDIDLYNP